MERIYIDAFAGPGSNVVMGSGTQVDGSPLIALNATARNGTRFSRLFFIENDPTIADELKAVLHVRDREKRAEVVVGDTNNELPSIIRQIHPRAPTFVFLDTEGIEPRWTALEAIASWRTELFINFPLGMSISRNLESPKVTDYFGTNEWRALWDSHGTGRIRAVLDLYKRRLASLGYKHQIPADRLIQGKGRRRLYYLMFASKVAPGKRIMEWVYSRPDASGQARMGI